MAYSLDHYMSFVNANIALATKLGELARENYADFALSGQKMLKDVAGKAKLPEIGEIPAVRSEALTAFWADATAKNEAALARVRVVLEEWQQACSAAATQMMEQASDAANAITRKGTDVAMKTQSAQDNPTTGSASGKAIKTAA